MNFMKLSFSSVICIIKGNVYFMSIHNKPSDKKSQKKHVEVKI